MAGRDVAILAGTGLLLGSLAFALSAARCARVARRPWPGLVDFPGGPLRGRVAVPLGGGLAIWLSTVVVLGLGALAVVLGRPFLPGVLARYVDGLWYRSGELALILGLATAVLIIGLFYDLFETGWWFRLGAQVVLAAILAASGCRVTLFWPHSDPAIGGVITTLWVVGLTNAFTFLDNMDGLAAGVGLIASLLFAAAQAQMGGLFAPAVLIVLAGALGGFLVYNRYPARVFLGDSGGGFIGFLLGAMTVAGTYFRYERDDSPYGVLSPLLVMAVPLYESVWVFLFWLPERNDSYLRNRRHFSYRLLESGLTPPQAVRVVLLVSLGAGLGAPLLHRLDTLGTLLVVGQAACLIGVLAILETTSIQRSRARYGLIPKSGDSKSPTGFYEPPEVKARD